MNRRRWGGIFRSTGFVTFSSMFLIAVFILLLTQFFIELVWSKLYSEYMDQHLFESMRRIRDLMAENNFTANPTSEQLKQLMTTSLREGVQIRWFPAAGSEAILDTFDPKLVSPDPGAITVPIWNNAGEALGQLSVKWKALSGNGYPSYNLNTQLRRTIDISLALGIIVACVVSVFAAIAVAGQLKKLTRKTDMLFQTRKLPDVPETGANEIKQVARALNFLSHQLEEQEQWRKILLQDLAHELRTPLMIVSNQLEAIVDGVFKPERRRFIEMLQDTSRLTRLVDDMERVLDANGAIFEMNMKVVDLVPIVKDTIAATEPFLLGKQIKLRLHTPKKPCSVRVDPDKMQQVFLNILSNAIKYTGIQGQIEIRVDLRTEEEMGVVEFKDNGIGISEEDLPHIFERFYRADKSRSRDTGGSGIGLTIAKRLIEAHEGRIEVVSHFGVGSAFTVWIPLSPVMHQHS